METTDQQTPSVPTGPFREFMRSHTARFIIVGLITLVLLIPLGQIGFLIEERKNRQEEVNQELENQWGGQAAYYGPVIQVPVREVRSFTTAAEKNKPSHQETEVVHYTGFIYPESSSEEISTQVTEKHRGIFRMPVFTAEISGKVRFDLSSLQVDAGKTVDWSRARITLVSGTGVHFQRIDPVKTGDKHYPITSQERFTTNDYLLFSSTSPFTINPLTQNTIEITTKLSLNGSQSIHYQPFAEKSIMIMQSNWNDPSFQGHLPNSNSLRISEKGFSGKWEKLTIGSGKSTLHIDKLPRNDKQFSEIRFIRPIDQYQLNERTIKYGILVLTLTFAVFFLIQIVGKIVVHPLHYFMIGLALLLFYSLLLSFSEQIGFIPAYILAASTIVLLIIWYARSVLRSLKFAVMSGLSLSLLYAFLLVIVNLEVYALIVGSIGLLVVLAGIMSVTRKINFETT